MQNNDEIFDQIINESHKKLVTLKLLCNFFSHQNLISTCIRTEIIHQMFENNRNLDVNKLDLFHIQYTSSLIDLFQKLKKNIEQQYLLITNEIYINNDFIANLEFEISTNNFANQVRLYSQKMSDKLNMLYKLFEQDSDQFFDWTEITSFSALHKAEFYRPIDNCNFKKLDFDTNKHYKNSIVTIERKLLGRLNILNFKVKFRCGFIVDDEVLEVFEFRDSNETFLFNQNQKRFYLIDQVDFTQINFSKNESNKNQIINTLKKKIIELNDQLQNIKAFLPTNVETVLNDYLKKISEIDFLGDLQKIDEQTNILKTMLTIKIN